MTGSEYLLQTTFAVWASPLSSTTTAYEQPADQNELDLEIVEIEPLVVTDSPVLRQLAAKIESDTQKLKDAQFSPIKGGTIYKNSSIEIGTWGDRSGLTLLKMSF